MRIAINGFGRIGRMFLRSILKDSIAQESLNVVSINLGPVSYECAAHLFKYDSVMGTYEGYVFLDETFLIIDNNAIELLQEIDPTHLPWKQREIDWVIECSGKFTKREGAMQHITAGAKKVLISAPATGEDVTIIPGVNDDSFNQTRHVIVSLGSCTTNALLPILKVLHERCDLQKGIANTIHAYTNSQVLLDASASDLRRTRAAAINIIPTTTGASEAIEKVIPELANKIECRAIRVPVPKVSLIIVSCVSSRSITVEFLNKTFREAEQDYLHAILATTEIPLVSSDYSGNSYSVIIDTKLTSVVDNLGTVFGWYDNEWAYAERLKDFLVSTFRK